MQHDGSAVRRVVFIESFRWLGAPRWSHDGKRLAFAAIGPAPSRCLTVDVSGRNLSDLGLGSRPDWSPDDKQIIFEAAGDHGATVSVQNADGKGSATLVTGGGPRWSPDGGQIAVLRPLRILDMAQGGERPGFDNTDRVAETLGVAWSPDGQRLAAVVRHNTATELLIVAASEPITAPRVCWQGALHGGIDWSPDGRRIAVSILDHQLAARRLHLLDPDGTDPPALIPGQQGDNCEPAWSPDGGQLAFASSRSDTAGASLAMAAPGGRLELVRTHDKGGTVFSAALSPDSRLAFLGGDVAHREMQVWDLTKDEVLLNIKMPGIFVAISPDGLRAACAELAGNDVQLLNLDHGTVIRSFAHGAQVIFVQFSPDGSRLASAGVDNTACVFDAATGAELTRMAHEGAVKQVAFSPDGQLLATACGDKKVHLWNAATGKLIRQLEHPAVPWSIAFSADGRRLASGTGGEQIGRWSDFVVRPATDSAVRIWDVETGNPALQLTGHTGSIASVAFAPDGKRIVSASLDRSLRLWDAQSGEELSRVAGKGWVTRSIFSSDGTLVLATGGTEKNMQTNRRYEAPNERVRLFKITQPGARPVKASP